MWSLYASTIALAVVITVIITTLRHFHSSLPYPPGPPGRGLAGNVHQITTVEYWKLYKTWSEIYGPIIHYRIFGRRYVILNDIRSALELLESRSSIYSDRPQAWMYKELVGRKYAVFNISSQHERFKSYRKILHAGLNTRAVSQYLTLFRQEADLLLQRLSETPQDFISHFRANSGAIIMKLAYGWTVLDGHDPFVRLMEDSFKLQSEITKPGRWLVDVFPILRFIPVWFPGGGFHRKAEFFKKEMNKVDVVPFEWAKKQIESGTYISSFTSEYLLREDGRSLTSEEEDIIKWCAGALYAGGADTTVAFMTAFVAAMTLYPDIQKRAQQEIDDYFGEQDILKPADQTSLSYIDSLIKEVFRWAPPAPLGLPHRVIESDTYNGYQIPKGATVFANIWAICRDESLYQDPLRFDPERYFSDGTKEGELDPRKFVFGFGRRVCPGAVFAEHSIFVNVCSILRKFNIEKSLDDNGLPITPVLESTATITSHIKPFPCSIKERIHR